MKTVWPHVRAALVLFHFVAIFILAFPAPVGGLDRSMWKDRSAQQDFESWSRFFHVSEPAFEEFLYRAAVTYMGGRAWVIEPFERYAGWTGCGQPWRMFVGPQRFPSRLQVQVHRPQVPPESWETLFEERSPEHRWHEPLFAQERLRSQINRWPMPAFRAEYEMGCAYFAKLEFAEEPTAEAVRCRFWLVQSPTPEEVQRHTEPPGAWAEVRSFQRPPLPPSLGGAQ